MDLRNYKITDGGIWIPKEEIIRLIEESYKHALEYGKDKRTEFQAAMLRTEGCANTWEHIYSKFEKAESDK